MELKDLIPEIAKFYLSSTGKEHELRTPNLEDRVEMVRFCGGKDADVLAVFQEKKWDQICKIVYRLLIDRSDFIAKKSKIIDDEGIEREVLVTGPILLLRAVRSQSEAIHMLGALTTALSAGEPLVKEFVASELKKNQSLPPLTGEKSSTSSQANTDTPQNNLENLLTGS